jgi:hypothetical protein
MITLNKTSITHTEVLLNGQPFAAIDYDLMDESFDAHTLDWSFAKSFATIDLAVEALGSHV